MTNPYDRGYFGRYFKALRQWEPEAARIFIDTFEVSGLVDFGCGGAFFVTEAHRKGLPTQGYELNLEAVRHHIDPEVCELIEAEDVTQPLAPGTFDCSMSMEVAEHIPPEGSGELVNNLALSADRLILFTAAPPGQGGTGHINLQPQEFWLDLFKAAGWELDTKAVDKLRVLWEAIPTQGYNAGHIIRNLMLLRPSGC